MIVIQGQVTRYTSGTPNCKKENNNSTYQARPNQGARLQDIGRKDAPGAGTGPEIKRMNNSRSPSFSESEIIDQR
jgi:hypothetical protein